MALPRPNLSMSSSRSAICCDRCERCQWLSPATSHPAWESITGKVSSEDLIQVVALPSSGSQEVRLAPVERNWYEQTYIPGGIRSRDTYEGFDIVVDYSVLARDFTTAAVLDSCHSE